MYSTCVPIGQWGKCVQITCVPPTRLQHFVEIDPPQSPGILVTVWIIGVRMTLHFHVERREHSVVAANKEEETQHQHINVKYYCEGETQCTRLWLATFHFAHVALLNKTEIRKLGGGGSEKSHRRHATVAINVEPFCRQL